MWSYGYWDYDTKTTRRVQIIYQQQELEENIQQARTRCRKLQAYDGSVYDGADDAGAIIRSAGRPISIRLVKCLVRERCRSIADIAKFDLKEWMRTPWHRY
jgi:hypothetical protein